MDHSMLIQLWTRVTRTLCCWEIIIPRLVVNNQINKQIFI